MPARQECGVIAATKAASSADPHCNRRRNDSRIHSLNDVADISSVPAGEKSVGTIVRPVNQCRTSAAVKVPTSLPSGARREYTIALNLGCAQNGIVYAPPHFIFLQSDAMRKHLSARDQRSDCVPCSTRTSLKRMHPVCIHIHTTRYC